jgi:tetratricopeptide (TPR) repeat protein
MSRPKKRENYEEDLRRERRTAVCMAWNRGSFASTIEAAEDYHRRYSGDWGTYFRLGDALRVVKRYSDALAELRKAIAQAPRDWRYAHTAQCMGMIHQAHGENALAEEWFRRAIERCPTLPQYRTALALHLAREGRREEAETVLEAAVQCHGNGREWALFERGLLRRRQRRYADAVADLSAVIETLPEHAGALAALRDVEEACQCVDIDLGERVSRAEDLGTDDYPATCLELVLPVIAGEPLECNAYLLHFQALQSLGLFPEAIAAIEVVRGIDFPMRALYPYLGGIYESMGDYEAAEDAYLRLREARSGHEYPLCYLAAMYREQGRLDEAESAAREGTKAEEGDIDEAFLFLGLALVGKRRYAEALGCFERAVEIDPEYDPARARIEDIEHLFRLFPRLKETSSRG